MTKEILPEVVASKTRLTIAGLLAVRPRTLAELADLTGVSVQGVLKHLAKLSSLGLVSESKVSGSHEKVRRLYGAKGSLVSDFSAEGLTLVRLTGAVTHDVNPKTAMDELEFLAEETLVKKRRIREQVRRIARLVDELADDEGRLKDTVDSLSLGDGEKAALMAYFTEESAEEAERALRKYYGFVEGRRSIEKAITKAGRNAKTK